MTDAELAVAAPSSKGNGKPPPAPKAKQYRPSLAGDAGIAPELAVDLLALEKELKLPVWLLVHTTHDTSFGHLDEQVRGLFMGARRELATEGRVAVVIDSPGGSARTAYQLAMLFRRQCKGWVAVVPRFAKSAATLLALGADAIYMGPYGELGPLDAQLFDPNREDVGSALDEVQALERLHARALEAFDESMAFLIGRTGKKVETLLPMAMHFVAETMSPLFEKVDAIHYTQTARVLKVAEEYAIRLLEPKYPREIAEGIARQLVERYPEHGFVIDSEEASKQVGLQIEAPSEKLKEMMDRIADCLHGTTLFGRVQEVKP